MLFPILFALLLALAVFVLTGHLWSLRESQKPVMSVEWLDRFQVHPLLARLSRPKKLDHLLQQAGLPAAWTSHRFLVLKELGLILFVLLLAILLPYNTSVTSLLLLGLCGFLAWTWPELFLKRRALLRKRRALKTLSGLIDILRLQIDAGAGLETAMRQLASYRKDLWGKELARVVFLLDRGVPFDQALESMADRFDLEDVRRLTLSIKQARLLGVSLLDTLTIQGDMLRTRRRQQAEEKARLASVKIVLPLVFFIFPALLIVYLAPAILHILQSF